MSDVQQRLILLEMAQVWIRLANQAGANESKDFSHETRKRPHRREPKINHETLCANLQSRGAVGAGRQQG